MGPAEDSGEDLESGRVNAVVDLKFLVERVAAPVESVAFVWTVGWSFGGRR